MLELSCWFTTLHDNSYYSLIQFRKSRNSVLITIKYASPFLPRWFFLIFLDTIFYYIIILILLPGRLGMFYLFNQVSKSYYLHIKLSVMVIIKWVVTLHLSMFLCLSVWFIGLRFYGYCHPWFRRYLCTVSPLFHCIIRRH